MNKCCNSNVDLNSILSQSSFRITKSKLDTLDLFYKSKVPIGSKEIISKLSKYNESTIFRNLIQFRDSDILEEVNLNEGYKRYTLKQSDHHHHYAKCNTCEKIIEVDSCSIVPIQKELKKKGFTIEAHKIEIFGICNTCL